jgi:predicted HTH domain antitoxin
MRATIGGRPGILEITLKLDEDVLSALRRSPDELANEMRLAAAIYWYKRGEIFQDKAAQVAGLGRTDFLLTLAREGEDAFVVVFADLERELRRTESTVP